VCSIVELLWPPWKGKTIKIFLDLCGTCERGTFFNQLHPTRLDCCRCYYFYSKGNLPADFDNHSIEIFFVCLFFKWDFFCWMDLSGFRSTFDDRMENKQSDWPKYWINFTKVPSHPQKQLLQPIFLSILLFSFLWHFLCECRQNTILFFWKLICWASKVHKRGTQRWRFERG